VLLEANVQLPGRGTAATGEWTYFIHSPSGELLSELRLSGGIWVPARDYLWLDGRPLAQIEYGASGERRVYYVHADHLGMPRKLTSEEGAVVWSATTRPYGEVTEATAPDPITGKIIVTNLRLPGQYDERLLASVGLQGPYYNWNRWYLPGAGRYLELDPIALAGGFNGFGTPDWYNYGNGNPLTYTDPSGRFAPPVIVIGIEEGIGLLLGAFCSLYPQHCGWKPSPPPSPCSKLITCKFLSAGGKGPAPGETMRCTYTCEDGGRQWQVERRYADCPDEITVRTP
jgi:RHS repeat-associated protein